MALGGGTFTAQNKVLPGTYVNVISRNSIKNNTESGVVAMPICLDWGPDDKIFEVTADEFEKVALEVLEEVHMMEILLMLGKCLNMQVKVCFLRLTITEQRQVVSMQMPSVRAQKVIQ